jgi:hypothetical protein
MKERTPETPLTSPLQNRPKRSQIVVKTVDYNNSRTKNP